MNWSQISLLLILTIHVCFVNTEILYGASVHWRPTSTDDEITLSYKLVWKRGFLPQCPPACRSAYMAGQTSATVIKPGILTKPRWQGYHWKCVEGCSTNRIISNLKELFYTDIDSFHNISWEAAMEMVTFQFVKGDDRANVKIGFFDSNDKPVDGLSEGLLSMATRNDTNRANISPAVNPLPYYRVPLGCSITIRFFPFDGDGDYVRCHWQTFPQKGSAESQVVLNEDKCEITVVADPNKGFAVEDNFTLALYAEDYSIKPVKLSSLSDDITTGPFSRAPFVSFLHVGETSTCTPGPDFIQAGTLPQDFVGSFALPFQNAKLPFKIPVDDNQVVLTSGPRYMAFGFNKDPRALQFEGTWDYINDTGMTGIHQACGMTYTKYGVPGDTRCAVLLVNEPNECPCPKKNGVNGTCRNLFEYHTCDYSRNSSKIIDQLRQTVTEQQQNISQLQALVNNQTHDGCQSSNTAKSTSDDDDENMKLIVGLPVGLSLLWLIILIIVACILKHYIDKKKQNTNINPDDTPSNSKFKGVPSVW